MNTKIKYVLLSLALSFMTTSMVYGQIRIGSNVTSTNSAVANSSAFIDASSNNTFNPTTNMGKGLLFPRVDLVAFTAFSGTPTGIPTSFPNRFDGMIVYNTATSGVAGVGSTEGTLSPGFWYYENKSATLTGGTWKPLGSGGGSTANEWIYCPPFVLEWESGVTGKTVNLYDQYTNGLSGFTVSSDSKRTSIATTDKVADLVGAPADFDYLVRYNSANPATPSITITGVSTAGVLTYNCTTTAPGNADFASVVLIRNK